MADLTPLAGLSGLQTLNLASIAVADLTPLAGLTALQTFPRRHRGRGPDAAGGPHRPAGRPPPSTRGRDLTPLAGLTALQTLYVASTAVADLTPLAGLSALQRSVANNTAVADLTPVQPVEGLRIYGPWFGRLRCNSGLRGVRAQVLHSSIVDGLVKPIGGLRPQWSAPSDDSRSVVL